jgi:hypothetical protein
MKLWITRPSSREVFMGGVRDLQLWIEPPAYHHSMKTNYDIKTDISTYTEYGWRSLHHDHGVPAKYWLKQSPALQSIVWSLVIHSLSPKDDDEHEWAADFDRYEKDTFDLEWEGKCKIPAKRFLLEIDLSSDCDEVNIIVPQIFSVDDAYILGYDLTSIQAIFNTFVDEQGITPVIRK